MGTNTLPGIINQPFFAVLVLLAIVTSLVAGTWLERIPRDRLLVRPENEEVPTVPSRPG